MPGSLRAILLVLDAYLEIEHEKGFAMSEGKKKPIGKIIIGVVVVFVLLAVIGGMGSGGPDDFSSTSGGEESSQVDGTQSADQKEPEAKYAITDEALDESGYIPMIKGTLTNNSGKDLSYIQVEYVIYDSDGAQVATALANTNNLKADGVWKYEAGILDTDVDVATYELVDVTAY